MLCFQFSNQNKLTMYDLPCDDPPSHDRLCDDLLSHDRPCDDLPSHQNKIVSVLAVIPIFQVATRLHILALVHPLASWLEGSHWTIVSLCFICECRTEHLLPCYLTRESFQKCLPVVSHLPPPPPPL